MSRYRAESWIPTVAEALDKHMQVAGLKKLAALVSSESLPTRKAELAALVLAQLRSDGALRSLFHRLDQLQQAAVAEVVHGPHARFEPARFRAKYGREPDWGPVSDYDRGARATPLCLFFYGPGVMPDDLRERLRAFVPPPRRASLAATDELSNTVERPLAFYDPATATETVPLVVRETERAAQHDLQAVLRLIESGKVAVSDRTRRPGKSATRLVAAALEGGDFYAGGPADDGDAAGPVKAFAWPLVVQAAGLARLAGSRLALTKAGAKALDASPATTLRTAWTRWLDTALLDELSRVDAIKGQTGKGKRGLTAVPGRRLAIADALAECPLGSWVETDELFRYMRAAGHEFEVTRDAWRLYICEPEYGSLGYDGCGGWDILQARYALCLLFEYAATLGLIDVAYVEPAGARPDFHELWGADGLEFLSRYDGLLHIRLTSLGAFCLGHTDAYEPAPLEARTALTVLPNFDVVATGDGLTFADRLALDRYAEKTSDRVWRLRRDKLLAAVEGGESVAAVREFLSARSAAPLPAGVVQMLEDVAERAGRLTDGGPARLIECADPALAALLAKGSSTRALCLAVGDRQLAVPAASERAFRRALRKLGYVLGAPAHGQSARKAA